LTCAPSSHPFLPFLSRGKPPVLALEVFFRAPHSTRFCLPFSPMYPLIQPLLRPALFLGNLPLPPLAPILPPCLRIGSRAGICDNFQFFFVACGSVPMGSRAFPIFFSRSFYSGVFVKLLIFSSISMYSIFSENVFFLPKPVLTSHFFTCFF